MAVRVRLTRVGSRKNPVWRVVVADQRSPRDGRVIETVGRYNAQTHPSEIVLNGERVRHWIARGAQPSNTVKRLMKTQGLSATGVTKARLSPEAPVESEGAEATSSDTAPPRSPEAGAASPESGTPGGEAGSPSSGAEAGQPPEGPDPGADPPTLPDGEMLAPGPDVEQADAGADASSEGDASAR